MAKMEKCGEIFSLQKENKNKFLIKCSLCQLEINSLPKFAIHYDKNHLTSDFKEDFVVKIETDPVMIENDGCLIPDDIKCENTGDPLEESSDSLEENSLSSVEQYCDDFLSANDDYTSAFNEDFQTYDKWFNDIGEDNRIDDQMIDDIDDLKYGCDDVGYIGEHIQEVFHEDPEEFKNLPESMEVAANGEINEVYLKQFGLASGKKSYVKFIKENKDLVIILIEAFKAEAVIWDNQHPYFADRERTNKAYADVVEAVKGKTRKELGLDAVRDLFKYFRKIMNRVYAPQRPYKSTPWYISKLDFLQLTKKTSPGILFKLSNVSLMKKVSFPMENLTDEEHIRLFNIYKSFTCLWNANDPNFYIKEKRRTALQDMHETIVTEFPSQKFTNNVDKLIYQIRLSCSQEKHRQFHFEYKNEIYKPVCKYIHHLSFLFDFVSPFKCHICLAIINGWDTYKIHKSKHDNSMPFNCSICKRDFNRKGNYVVHLKRHIKNTSFACDVCGKGFTTPTEVKIHMRFHSGEKPYVCELCGQKFRAWSAFDIHKKRHLKITSFKCNICSSSFYTKYKLKVHMKAHLGLRDKICDICGKGFTDSKYLTQHKKIHDEQKQYKCKICFKEFSQSAGLSGHMKRHGTKVHNLVQEGK